MKYIISIIAVAYLLVGSQNATAQEVSATWSDDIKLPSGHYLDEPLGLQGDNLYLQSTKMVYYSGFFPYIGLFNAKSMKLGEMKQMSAEKGKTRIIGTVFNNKGKWGVFQNFDNGTRYNIIKTFPLDENGQPEKSKVAILAAFRESKGTTIFGSEVLLITSKDSSHNAVVMHADRKDKDNELLYIVTCDKSMNMVWKQVIELPYSNKRFSEDDIEVLNSGKIVLSGKLYDEQKAKERKSKTTAAYKYVLRIYDGKDTDGKEFVMDLGGKFVVNTILATHPKTGNTVFAGMYSDVSIYNAAYNSSFQNSDYPDTRGGAINGLFYLELDNDGKIANNYTYAINASAIPNISKGLFEKRQNGIDPNLKIQRICFRNNGGAVFVTEPRYRVEHSYTDSKGRTTTYYTYHTLDNVLFAMKEDGTNEWTTCVPKILTGRNSSVVGSTCIFNNDNVYLVYNDSEKNLLKKPDGKPDAFDSFDKGMILMAKINGKGELVRKAITSRKELGGYLYSPKSSRTLSEDELIFVGRKSSLFGGQKYKIGRIKLNFKK